LRLTHLGQNPAPAATSLPHLLQKAIVFVSPLDLVKERAQDRGAKAITAVCAAQVLLFQSALEGDSSDRNELEIPSKIPQWRGYSPAN